MISLAESRARLRQWQLLEFALNNRPAQIESGSQIPVQTTQAASGTAVVTTTLLPAPRLSITPQITDVGTVCCASRLKTTRSIPVSLSAAFLVSTPSACSLKCWFQMVVQRHAVACWRIQKVNLNSAPLVSRQFRLLEISSSAN